MTELPRIATTGIRPLSLPDNATKVMTIRHGTHLHIGTTCRDGRPITESWRYQQALEKGGRIIRRKVPLKGTPIAAPPATVTDSRSFVDRYTPTTLAQVIGHKSEIETLRGWLLSWKPEGKLRGVLITGPPGIGKTTIAHLLAKECGYQVTEYNASDVRSVSKLKGIFALGMRRLQKEVIIMDEVDGASERGGVVELAAVIERSLMPMICIANERSEKLAPLKHACHEMRFSRPTRSTIATALLRVVAAEEIAISKAELEQMCERNGNDIRAVLNQLEFYGKDAAAAVETAKDSVHRLDAFSVAGKLLGQYKPASFHEASELVFVDYFMIPKMIQEGHVASNAKGDFEDTVLAADMVSQGDLMERQLMRTQDWSLLPTVVANTVCVSRLTTGPAPFQIFPQQLGKLSKRAKHARWLEDMARRQHVGRRDQWRMDYFDGLRTVVGQQLLTRDASSMVSELQERDVTREDIFEAMEDIRLGPTVIQTIPTKVKTALTREWNKRTMGVTGKKRKVVDAPASDEENDEEVEELANEMSALELEA